MGRTVKIRSDYLKDSMHLYRLVQAIKADPILSDIDKERVNQKGHELISMLMDFDKRRKAQKGKNNV